MGCEVSITVQEQDLEAVLDSFVKADWFFVAVKKANQILEMRKGNLENWTENIITPLCKFSHAVTLSTVCTSDLVSQKTCWNEGASEKGSHKVIKDLEWFLYEKKNQWARTV